VLTSSECGKYVSDSGANWAERMRLIWIPYSLLGEQMIARDVTEK